MTDALQRKHLREARKSVRAGLSWAKHLDALSDELHAYARKHGKADWTRAREDVDAERAESRKSRHGFEIVWAPADDGDDGLEPLIDGYYFERSLAALYGKYGEGKSFVALDQALCVATGRPWFGRTVAAGAVLYFAAEGAMGMKRRIAAWCAFHGLASTPDTFGLVRGVLDIGDPDAIDALAKEAKAAKVKLIVLDTLNAIFGAGDENDTKAMTAARHALERLRDASGAAVLVIHHAGKDVDRGLRGSSVLGGACDHVILVDSGKIISRAPKGKQKDLEPADDAAFLLTPVDLPDDSKGRPRRSAVLEPTTERFTSDAPDAKLTQREAHALRLWNTVKKFGERTHEPATEDDWRALFYSEMRDASGDAKKKAFQRARDSLSAKGLIQ